MRKKRVTLWFIFLLILSPLFLLGIEKNAMFQFDKSGKLRSEIRILNLLNGLEITSGQREIILRKAKEIMGLRQEFQSLLLSHNEEMERVLKEIKISLWYRKELPSSLAQHFHRLNTKLKQARVKMEEKIREKAQEVKEALDEHQVYQLQQYVPCIIPPKGDLRIGQVKDLRGPTKKLERIRHLPYRLYQRKKGEIIERTLEAMKLHMPRSMEINEVEVKKHLSTVFDKIRSLKEVEFEIQKEKIAEELVSSTKPQAPSGNFDINRKIEAFLLSPVIISLLEK